MNTAKIGGRATLLLKGPDMEAIVGWLTEQPDVQRLLPRAFKPGRTKGAKAGLRIDNVVQNRLLASLFNSTGRQELMIMAKDDDAAVAVAARVAQKYGSALPATAHGNGNNGRALTAPLPPKPKLVEGPATKHTMTSQAEQAEETTKGKIEVTLRKITPDTAATWLEQNTLNRPMSQRVVDRYASDMIQGRWGVSDSVIAFDTKGRLLNGQHRLWAIVESNVPIVSHVATGYPPEAIAYFDDGFRRDAAQVYNLTHNGAEVSKAHMAVARRLAGGGWRKTQGIKQEELSRQDVAAVLERFHDGIDFAVRELRSKTSAGASGVRTSAVLTVVARAFYAVDRTRLEQFCEVLRTGMVTGPNDNAAVLLRNWLIAANTNNHAGQNDAYAKTENALDKFLHNENATRNLYPATTELYPLPGEDRGVELVGESVKKMRRAAEAKTKANLSRKAAGKLLTKAAADAASAQ